MHFFPINKSTQVSGTSPSYARLFFRVLSIIGIHKQENKKKKESK